MEDCLAVRRAERVVANRRVGLCFGRSGLMAVTQGLLRRRDFPAGAIGERYARAERLAACGVCFCRMPEGGKLPRMGRCACGSALAAGCAVHGWKCAGFPNQLTRLLKAVI